METRVLKTLSAHQLSAVPSKTLSNLSPAGRIFAIIICIDRYKARNGLLDLNGCTNDGRQFEDFLTKLKVPKSQICWCTNENATYQGIMRLLTVAASDDLMTLFPNGLDFRKGDLIILFYAGHGGRSRSTTPSLWKNPGGHVTDDGEIELICPHDIDTQGVDQTRVHGIPDFVFGNLLDTIAAKHGGNVVRVDEMHTVVISIESQLFCPYSSRSWTAVTLAALLGIRKATKS